MLFKYLKSLYEQFIKNVLLYSFIIGVIFLILGYSNIAIYEDSFWKDVFKSIGNSVLAGGVYLAIAKSYQFTNILKEELRDVIYAKEHLDKRKDIHDIWLKVSTALCKQKFSIINKDVFENVKKNYLPFEDEFYYELYDVEIEIDFDENNENYICESSIIENKIVVDDPDGFHYTFEYMIPMPDNDNDNTKYSLDKLVVNDIEITDFKKNGELIVKPENGNLRVSFKKHFPEIENVYRIIREEKINYHLEKNKYSPHRASWIYQCFKVRISYPKNLEINWQELGVLDEWDYQKTDNNSRYIIRATYESYLFKNQGYMLIYSKL